MYYILIIIVNCFWGNIQEINILIHLCVQEMIQYIMWTVVCQSHCNFGKLLPITLKKKISKRFFRDFINMCWGFFLNISFWTFFSYMWLSPFPFPPSIVYVNSTLKNQAFFSLHTDFLGIPSFVTFPVWTLCSLFWLIWLISCEYKMVNYVYLLYTNTKSVEEYYKV